jgi:hypothetical protein
MEVRIIGKQGYKQSCRMRKLWLKQNISKFNYINDAASEEENKKRYIDNILSGNTNAEFICCIETKVEKRQEWNM